MTVAEMPKAKYFKLILILGSLTTHPFLSIDMYLPGFVNCQRFEYSVANVSMTLSSYFIGTDNYCMDLLDRFGRRKPLFIGLLVYILASLGLCFRNRYRYIYRITFCSSYWQLCSDRCIGIYGSRLISCQRYSKVFSLLMLVVGLSMLAPTVGGYVTEYWLARGLLY
jgi:DHA1 family bicyclomycin/chloramphenicol resistance-like MFS transporter